MAGARCPRASDLGASSADALPVRGRACAQLPGPLPSLVETVLLVGGFAIEGRLPVMVVDDVTLADPDPPEGVQLIVPETNDDFFGMSVVLAEAYDEAKPPSRADIARQRDAVAAGAIAVIARDLSGAVVGAGSCSPNLRARRISDP